MVTFVNIQKVNAAIIGLIMPIFLGALKTAFPQAWIICYLGFVLMLLGLIFAVCMDLGVIAGKGGNKQIAGLSVLGGIIVGIFLIFLFVLGHFVII